MEDLMYIGGRVHVVDPDAINYGEMGLVRDMGFDWVEVTFDAIISVYEYELWQVEAIMAIKAIGNVRPWKV